MKKLIVLLFFVIGICSCKEVNEPKDMIKSSVKEHLKLYPKAELADLYKLFFQGEFGPGHFVIDKEKADKYLSYELANGKSFNGPDFYYCGNKQIFVRANLSLVYSGRVSKELFLEAFLNSAAYDDYMSVEDWQVEWNEVYSIIKNMNLSFENEKQHKISINNNLKNGIFVGHHSRKFVELYDPHYRVMLKTEYDKMLKKAE